MEGPSAKRRKLEQGDWTTQISDANDYDVGADLLTGRHSESTVLVTHRYDVCFGMVKVAMKTLRLDALGADGDLYVEVSLTLQGVLLTARNITTQVYGGSLGRQHQSTFVLRELYERHGATLRPWLIRSDTSTRKKPVYELFIVIYGMHSQRNSIGDVLDGGGLFLQDPPDHIRGDRYAPYLNPHRLCNPTIGSGVNTPPEPGAILTVKNTKQERVISETDPLKQIVREVIDSACGPQYFGATQQSPRIRTRLKQHQTKALSMMLEKESGCIDKNVFGSVWTVIEPDGSIKYKNTVTGSVQTNFPRLCRGGILADDMGLGKTLTAISLVAASKDSTEFTDKLLSSPQTTLIVAPLSLLQTWEEQITSHVHHGHLSYYVYYGASKGDISSLTEYDIVLTTYDTILNEGAIKSSGTSARPGLGSIEWLRVILDEAHIIRNRRTKRFRAIHALQARFRWCLTGTPIFNRIEDLGSLMEFLGAYPFDTPSTFNSRLAKPLMKGTPNGLGTLRRLVHATSLRRTKDSIRGELSLTGRVIIEELVQLTQEEQSDYDLLKSSYASILHENDGSYISRCSTASIMQTIGRLRQFCDHGLDLLPRKALQIFGRSTTAEELSWNLFDTLEACAVCRASIDDSQGQCSLDCGHYLCFRCQKKASDEEMSVDIVCKICDQDLANSGSSSPHPSMHLPVATSDYVPSSKVQALLQNLMSERQSSIDQTIKSVVFSCWTKMLDLVQKALRLQGLDFVRIDGTKTEKERREAILRFRGDPHCGILLATIGSAGVGLDLTVASRVHILEPQWTQTAENQAIDRVHRLGQTQDVIAKRYIVQNSIEEYVLTIQDRKAGFMRQAFDADGLENTASARERLLQYLSRTP